MSRDLSTSKKEIEATRRQIASKAFWLKQCRLKDGKQHTTHLFASKEQDEQDGELPNRLPQHIAPHHLQIAIPRDESSAWRLEEKCRAQ